MVNLPKIVIFFINIPKGLLRKVLHLLSVFFYYFSFLVDAVIYIFLHPGLKRLFWRKAQKVPVLSGMIRHYEEQYRREEMTSLTIMSSGHRESCSSQGDWRV